MIATVSSSYIFLLVVVIGASHETSQAGLCATGLPSPGRSFQRKRGRSPVRQLAPGKTTGQLGQFV